MANSLALVWDLLAIDNASRVFERVGLSAESAGLKTEGAGKRIATGLLGATAVVAGIGIESIKMAGDFEAATTRLVTSAGETNANLDLVRKGMLDMAGQVGISATDLAKGMYVVESAGYHGADALNVLKASAQGAKTENADLGTVANAVSTIMRDFGDSAGDATHVTSTLISAVSVGKTNFQDLSGAMHAVMPRAAALHMSFPELAADLATMTAHGMSAEQSAQNLNGALRNLSNPTLAMSKRMADFGIQSHDVSANLSKDGLQGTLEKLSATIMDRMGPAGAQLKSVWNQSNLAAQDAQKMFDALSPKAQKLAQDYRDGKIQMHDWTVGVKYMDTANGNLLKQWASQENASKGFSNALKTGGDTVKTYTGALSGMVGGQEATTVALMLTGDQAKFATDNIKTVTGATNDASGAVKGFGEQQQTLNGKLDDAKAALKSLMITLGNQLVPAAKEAFDNLNQIFGQFAKGWQEGFAEIGRRLVANLTETGVMLREKMSEIWSHLLATVVANNDAIRDYMLARWADIRRNASEWWHGVLADISGVWNLLVQRVRDNSDAVRQFMLDRWADIRRNASDWWHGVLDDISGVWRLLVKRVSDNSDAVRDYLLARWADIRTNASTWWTSIVDGISGIWGNIVRNVEGPLNSVLTFINAHFIQPLNAMFAAIKVDIKIPDIQLGGLAGIPTGPARHAGGGTVGGWSPHDAADNIPALLTADEEVIRQRSARNMRRQHPGVMEWINEYGTLPGHALGGRVRGYADGGSVWDTIKSTAGNVATTAIQGAKDFGGFLTDPVGKIKELVGRLLGGIGSGIFPDTARRVLTDAGGALADQVKSILTAAAATVTGGGGGGGGTPYSGPVGAGVEQWRNLATQMLAREGQDVGLIDTLLRRMNQESGGNPNAINLWDSNAIKGTPSKGLMQVIDPTFATYHDPGLSSNIYDPSANIASSILYAKGNYGSLARAYNRAGGYAEGGRVQSYDTGGWLQPGWTAAYNGTAKPERVSTAEQDAASGGTFHLYDVAGVLIGTMRGEIARAGQHAQLAAAAGSSVAIR